MALTTVNVSLMSFPTAVGSGQLDLFYFLTVKLQDKT